MKKYFLYTLVSLLGFGTQAQTTIVTSPPLAPNTGASGISFEVTAYLPINITSLSSTFNAGAVSANIWYRVGGVLHGSASFPVVSPTNGWILAGTVTGTSVNNLTPIALPFSGFTIPVAAGQTVAIVIATSGCRYANYFPTNQTTFNAGGVFVKTGPGFGFGGNFPNLSSSERQFTGSLTFVSQGTCLNPPFVGNAVSNKTIICSGESFTLSLDTATYGAGQTYQWQKSTDSITWTNVIGPTSPLLTTSQTATNYYRCQVTCGTTATSASVKVFVANTALAAGTYTINSALLTGGTNFKTFNDFANAVKCVGIAGPIHVNVAPNSGPYNEQVYFPRIVGSSAINKITINGNGNTIQKIGWGSNRAVITFDSTRHTVINDLVILNYQSENAYGVEMRNDARFITLNNCVVEVNQTSISASVSAIVTSNDPTNPNAVGLSVRSISITNCEIIGGYFGVHLNGPNSAPWSNDNIIENNTIRDFYMYGIYMRGQINSQIKGNDITRAQRTVLAEFYGIYMTSGMQNVTITGNAIHNISDAAGTAGQAWGIYATDAVASFTSPCIVSNNLIYNLNNNGQKTGVYVLGVSSFFNFYHNTISLGNPNGIGITHVRAMFIATTALNNVMIYTNNIFDVRQGGTGSKYCVYLQSPNTTHFLNSNQYHVHSFGFSNYIGFFGSNQATFAEWQIVNNGTFEQNGVEGDPMFEAPHQNNLTPLSSVGNNLGQNLSALVPVDFYGVARPSAPDMGAIEYTPIAEDIVVSSARLTRSQCLTSADTVMIDIKNTIGSTVNFATDSLVAVWEVTGPVNSTGIIVANADTLALNGTYRLEAYTVNLSVPGIYTLNAYILPNAKNLAAANDTLIPINFEVKPNFTATPKFDTVYSNVDSVQINLKSPFIQTGTIFITEVCHFKSNFGEPVLGWPSYLLADDYIEITGVPGSSLAGYTLEQWTGGVMVSNNTFATGTIFSPNGTMIVAVGQLGTSVPSPADYYYHDGNTTIFNSASAVGRIIKDPQGNIIDAVVYGNYTFPAAANVTAAQWSGTTSSLSSAGNRLEGEYTRDATNWINSNFSPQNPNAVNAKVVVPSANGIVGFAWSLNGQLVDTVPNTYVGPWHFPGTYQYIATYNTPCGILTDTVNIFVDIPMPCLDPTNVATANAGCTDVEVVWGSEPGKLNSKIEFGPSGFIPGTGTVVQNTLSPQNINGLTEGTNYDFYVIDSCAVGNSRPVVASATTQPLPVASATGTLTTVTSTDATANFDASPSTNFNSIAWNFGDGSFGIGVNPTHTYVLNDVYNVMAIATGDCGTDTLEFQLVVAGIGISESALARSLKIYPNPTSGLARIELFSTDAQQIGIQMSSISGQTLMRLPTENAQGAFAVELDLSEYPAGIYLLQITTQHGVITRRIQLSK